MFAHLQIAHTRERTLVGLADVALAPFGWRRVTPPPRPVRRILLLRLERIGDLLMTLEAFEDARRFWPAGEIDLAVGSWNAPVASLVPDISRIELVDVPWLAREGRGDSWPSLMAKAHAWREREYDLVINFEPDIRSNWLAWLSGASRRVGYASGGGGALLTDAGVYDTSLHVSDNARRLVARAADHPPAGPHDWTTSRARLDLPADAVARAHAALGQASRPLVGIHASGGRESKQWHLDRFAAVARALADARGATIVLTGTAADRPLIDRVKRNLGGLTVIDVAGLLDLPALAALLAELDVFVTSDTGPMHLAAAVGTPIAALFGPSHPHRYGPRAERQRILRVDLPCSPCGQVRLPPARCRGHVPDCMDGIRVETVVAAALELLETGRA